MTDVLRQLRKASWRGIEFPVMSRDFGFSHDQERHRFLFRDEQLIESLGRENPTYRYSIPFREDLVKAPWVNLFTVVYPDFLNACLDRSNGDLFDPVHGPVQVKCASLTERVDVNRRDGIDVDVEFLVSPDETLDVDVAENLSTIEGAQALGAALDRDATEIDPETQAEIDALNKGSERGRLNPLDFATSVLNQVEANGNKIQAAFGDVVFRAEKLDESLGRTRDPNVQPMRANARRLALIARDLQRTAIGGNEKKTKLIGVYTVPADTGVISLAGKLGNSPQDLIKLNPTIARRTTIESGEQIAYYR